MNAAAAVPESATDADAHAWRRRRQAIRNNAQRIVLRGGALSALVATLASFTAPFGVGLVLGKVLVFAGPLVLAFILRLGVASIAQRQARSRRRRVLLRWIPRVLWLSSLWLWGFAAVPMLSIVAAPAALTATTLVTASYVVWTVDREARGAGVAAAEWLILALAAAAAAAAFTALVLVALGVGWLAHLWTTLGA